MKSVQKIIDMKRSLYSAEHLNSSELSKLSVVITTHNQKNELINCISSILEIPEICNIIVLDNHSTDGTSNLLEDIGANYIFFDEKIEPWGYVWNTVLENFDLTDYVLFIDPIFSIDKQSILWLIETLKDEKTGVAAPLFDSNLFLQRITESTLSIQSLFSDVVGVFGFIFAIKKEIIGEVGNFDNSLCDPDNVVTDFGIRLLKLGYKNRVSERSFAFCSGDLFSKESFFDDSYDLEILKEKYGTNYFNKGANPNLYNYISHDTIQNISVLEIGCDLGATLLKIKSLYPNSTIKGLEINPSSVEIAKTLCDVRLGDIQDLSIPFDEKFDYIIFGDCLEHLRNTEDVVKYCRTVLNPNGAIIASIPNLMHISVMEQLIDGKFSYTNAGLLDRTHIHFFTYYEIEKMFHNCGFNIERITAVTNEDNLSDRQINLIKHLVSLSDKSQDFFYLAVQYVLIARMI